LEADRGGKPSSNLFRASTKYKDRGYAKSTEITGPNGGPLQVAPQKPIDLSELTDKELAALDRLLEKASPKKPAPRKTLGVPAPR